MTVFLGYFLLFGLVAVFFLFFHLVLGRFIRPVKPDPEKLTIYECGEPTIGSSWIQFDLRFYVVALLFVIFDVEVVFFFPWAVVFGHATALAKSDLPLQAQVRKDLTNELVPLAQRVPAGQARGEDDVITSAGARQLAWLAFWDILVFFGVLLVGFAYLWKRGDLDWVRSTITERLSAEDKPAPSPALEARELAGAGRGL